VVDPWGRSCGCALSDIGRFLDATGYRLLAARFRASDLQAPAVMEGFVEVGIWK